MLLGIPALLANGYRRDRHRLGPAVAFRSLRRHVLVLATLYVTALAILTTFEDHLIFLTRPRESMWAGSPGCTPQEVDIPAPGRPLKAWWCLKPGV